MEPRDPVEVIPPPLGAAVGDLATWFVIGGQAVRCFCPYRPSRDVDFGVRTAADLDGLLRRLRSRGKVESIEREKDTVHLRFEGIAVSIFVLANLVPFTEGRCLTPAGVLATKVHAILDRGRRRDFIDLYVMLQTCSLGIADIPAALRQVFRKEVPGPLLYRALTWFEEADREARLPGEAPGDWAVVKGFLGTRVGSLLLPPARPLGIQRREVDVGGPPAP